jgi:hypothetical protein
MRTSLLTLSLLTLLAAPAASQINQWAVTVDSVGSPGTVHVAIQTELAPESDGCVRNAVKCASPIWTYYLEITPCPLALDSCYAGTYTKVCGPPSDSTFCGGRGLCDTLSLQADVTYLFSGHWEVYVLHPWGPDQVCSVCTGYWPFRPTTFRYDTTPAKLLTWGGLKTLYRGRP